MINDGDGESDRSSGDDDGDDHGIDHDDVFDNAALEGQRSTNHPRGALGRSLSPEASVPNQGVGAQKPNLGVVRPPLPIRPEATGTCASLPV